MLKPYQKAEISFRELAEIGHDGKNSKVFKVHDPQLDAEIVIKKIPKSEIPDLSEYYNEAKILYKSKHSNVVNIHYACEDSDFIYLAMPYYKNGSIKQKIDSAFLTVREITRYALQAISGLHNIHSKRLVHLDLKPDNILINDYDEAMVADFGQAKQINHLGLAEQDRLYHKQVAPEAFDTNSFDLRYDIYQIGLSMYRMCNGNNVYNNQYESYKDPSTGHIDRHKFKFAVKNGRFPDKNVYLSHIPKKLRAIINKCIEPDPDRRYTNCIKLGNDLSKLDHSLDWQYEKDSTSERWFSKRDDKIFLLVKDSVGFIATKKMIQSGRTTRLTDFCKNNLNSTELYRFFKEI